jgi:hypothetical protein
VDKQQQERCTSQATSELAVVEEDEDQTRL